MSSGNRGTGRTTRQMQKLPQDGIFVWCNGHLAYPKALAQRLNRPDIRVVSPEFIRGDRWQGMEFTALEVDHHLWEESLNQPQRWTNFFSHYFEARTRVREKS